LTATYRRLSSSGRQMLDEVALDQGRCPRRASALAAGSPAPRALRYPAGALAWLTGLLAVSNPADMLVTHPAAVAFDAEPELHLVLPPPW